MMHWYVAHTHSNAEELARRNLERQGFEVYLPVYRKQRRHARKTTDVRAPLFPRYLFTAFDTEVASWRRIFSTFGIVSLICDGNTPMSVPNSIISEISARENSEGFINRMSMAELEVGTEVEITGGAMTGQRAFFEGLSENDRVIVLLSLLGRKVRTTVAAELVSAHV